MIALILAALLFMAIAFIIHMRAQKVTEDNARLVHLQEQETNLHNKIVQLTESVNNYSQNIISLQQQKQHLEDSIVAQTDQAKERIEKECITHRKLAETKMQDLLTRYATKCEEEVTNLLTSYNTYRGNIEEKQNTLAANLEDYASRYVSTLSTYRQLTLEEEKLFAYTIQLSKEDIEDIDYLIQIVIAKIHNPQILNKLIWSEYVQKPTTDMLGRILDKKDCSGIYKITHIPSKKAYIGRSVSVRNRLQEHVKSSLGVGTIADQIIHRELRDKGLHNFTFELIEECGKESLGEREKYYINLFDTENYGYNQTKGG